MDLASKKLAFIEDYLHISNEKIIDKLSSILKKEKTKSGIPKKSLLDFFGILNKTEGEEFKRITKLLRINNPCSKEYIILYLSFYEKFKFDKM